MASTSRQAGTVTGEPHFASDLRPGPGTQIEYYTREDGLGNLEAQFQYLFDPMRRRVAKVDQQAGQGEWFAYEDSDVVFDCSKETSGSLSPSASYVQGGGVDSKYLRFLPVGSIEMYLVDAIGTPPLSVAPAGSVLTSIVATAWGEVLILAGATQDRYVGSLAQRELNLESNSLWLRARSLDASVGRFLQPDPLGSVFGALDYVYADLRPSSLTDPTGQLTAARFLQDHAPEPPRAVIEEGTINMGLHRPDFWYEFEFEGEPRELIQQSIDLHWIVRDTDGRRVLEASASYVEVFQLSDFGRGYDFHVIFLDPSISLLHRLSGRVGWTWPQDYTIEFTAREFIAEEVDLRGGSLQALSRRGHSMAAAILEDSVGMQVRLYSRGAPEAPLEVIEVAPSVFKTLFGGHYRRGIQTSGGPIRWEHVERISTVVDEIPPRYFRDTSITPPSDYRRFAVPSGTSG